MQILMDRELSDEVRDEALSLARAVEGVVNVHDFRSRQSGHDWFMQMHVEIPAQTPLLEAHDLGERVRARIIERFPQADVLIRFEHLCLAGRAWPAAPRRPYLAGSTSPAKKTAEPLRLSRF